MLLQQIEQISQNFNYEQLQNFQINFDENQQRKNYTVQELKFFIYSKQFQDLFELMQHEKINTRFVSMLYIVKTLSTIKSFKIFNEKLQQRQMQNLLCLNFEFLDQNSKQILLLFFYHQRKEIDQAIKKIKNNSLYFWYISKKQNFVVKRFKNFEQMVEKEYFNDIDPLFIPFGFVFNDQKQNTNQKNFKNIKKQKLCRYQRQKQNILKNITNKNKRALSFSFDKSRMKNQYRKFALMNGLKYNVNRGLSLDYKTSQNSKTQKINIKNQKENKKKNSTISNQKIFERKSARKNNINDKNRRNLKNISNICFGHNQKTSQIARFLGNQTYSLHKNKIKAFQIFHMFKQTPQLQKTYKKFLSKKITQLNELLLQLIAKIQGENLSMKFTNIITSSISFLLGHKQIPNLEIFSASFTLKIEMRIFLRFENNLSFFIFFSFITRKIENIFDSFVNNEFFNYKQRLNTKLINLLQLRKIYINSALIVCNLFELQII